MPAESGNPLSHRSTNAGTLCGLFAILLWSTTVALARSLSEQIGPLTSAAFVYCVSGIVSTVYLCLARERIRQMAVLPRAYLWGCGALFVFYMLVLFLGVGLAKTDRQAIEVGLLNYLWPALTILLSLVLLRKRATWLFLPGTLLALVGTVLVMTPDGNFAWTSFAGNLADNPAPYTLGLLAAISWALYSNLTRRWAAAKQTGAVDAFLPASGVVLLGLAVAQGESSVWSSQAIGEGLFLGVVTWLAYRFWDVAMRRGDVVIVAACSYLTPFLSTIISCLYLEVTPPLSLWIGCALIVGGSLLTWVSVSERPTQARG